MKKQGLMYGAVLMVTLAFVLSASLALAGPGGWGGGGGMGQGYGKGGRGCGMGGYLNTASLTPEQSQQIQTLREAYLKEITPLQTQLFTKRSELRLLWASATPDKDQIMAKQGEINALQQQIQAKATQHQLEVRSIAGQ